MTQNSADVTAGTNATATQYNNLRKDLVTGANTVVTATDGATVTFNLANGKFQKVTLGGNRTLAVSNVLVDQVFTLLLLQDGTGSRTVTWFSTIQWSSGVVPTLTTTAGKYDVFGFICIASNTYLGFVLGQNL